MSTTTTSSRMGVSSPAIVASAIRPIRIPFVPGTAPILWRGGAKIPCGWRAWGSARPSPQEMSNHGFFSSATGVPSGQPGTLTMSSCVAPTRLRPPGERNVVQPLAGNLPHIRPVGVYRVHDRRTRALGGEEDALPIRGPRSRAVELGVEGELHQIGAVRTHRVDVLVVPNQD